MDSSRFDQLARNLASRHSRRSVMKSAAAAAVAAVAGWNSVAAKKGGSGGSGGSACANDPTICTGGLVCCASGKGSRCMSVDKCRSDPICPAGQQFCATTGACGECCVDSDCPLVANGTGSCQQGVCQSTCNVGFADCDAVVTNGCEVDLNTDTNNCGACGNVCRDFDVCQDGVCSSPCVPGMTFDCSLDNPNVVRCYATGYPLGGACTTTVDGEAVCVPFGSFATSCTVPCSSAADCSYAGGYACVEVGNCADADWCNLGGGGYMCEPIL